MKNLKNNLKNNLKKSAVSSALLLSLINPVTSALAQTDLNVAEYTENNELLYPGNLPEWIHMGTSMGGDYNENQFDPENPGTLGVVQMEPNAYRYFLEHKEYADGTMFLLSFFESESKSEPQLQGFVQGAMTAQEIHVIDKQLFAEGRGFFLYNSPSQVSAQKVPDGSNCVECHTEHADFDATFTQFYPTIRDQL